MADGRPFSILARRQSTRILSTSILQVTWDDSQSQRRSLPPSTMPTHPQGTKPIPAGGRLQA
ncbi:hypothetical protein LZ30DRAFT_731945 [Colletotrichum cereale]|nr:hypothetical protein LZ30DRAFT_731945 [Colletotrichum cereale]